MESTQEICTFVRRHKKISKKYSYLQWGFNEKKGFYDEADEADDTELA